MMGAQRVAELRFQGKRKTNSITHPHGELYRWPPWNLRSAMIRTNEAS
jgi:hypothetical protein